MADQRSGSSGLERSRLVCLCSGRPHWIHGGLAKTGLVPRRLAVIPSGSENRQWSLASASWNELVRWGSIGAATGVKVQDEHQLFSLSTCKQTGSSGPTSRSRPPLVRPRSAPSLLITPPDSLQDLALIASRAWPAHLPSPDSRGPYRRVDYVSRYLITPRAKRRRAMCVRVSAP